MPRPQVKGGGHFEDSFGSMRTILPIRGLGAKTKI